ncbi:sigma-54-dependent transcriptional regulator [Marinobacterium marinum]|uniref:Sigma-54-dependent Fis family transcriptional regulator n=1 Tax=Marinobacterium marinum TaxID=2756129 RepID=A0A7W1WVC3_9GAMM|nr:sigma-54 dependent transcriptional regulator [Marinobacterium marinum]MBA4500920.1 sigma-54-dependent Fis family transcriptional regulator [Marinobacterium marinum]
MSATVLIVEDDVSLREAIADTLELADIRYLEAGSAEEALELLQQQRVAMVVSDVNMPGMDGHALLAQLKTRWPALPVALITAYGQVHKAVEAIREGAVDYVMKPFEPEQLIGLIRTHALGVSSPTRDEPIARAPGSRQLLQLAQRVAVTGSTVLITGESGTGKEVLARYIHDHSTRAAQPFIAINCAAIPESMLEATLFGHEKGAFTGAIGSQPGKFEQANGGTLLLDEISEMELGLQAKLLRVLQEQEVERIGGRKVISLDVRVLATSNRQLEQAVAEGRFREDLYYRLNVFPLQWQPLRERAEDIEPLAQRLLAHHCAKMGRAVAVLDTDAVQRLCQHDWPGNVRELDNVIQRALILQGGTRIQSSDLHLGTQAIPLQPAATQHISALQGEEPVLDGGLDSDLKQHEYQLIVDALKATAGSRKDAAEKLGISPRTLRYKLARMREEGIDLESMLAG